MHARRLGRGQQQPREGPATASPRPTPRDPRRPTARAPHVAVILAQTRGPVTPPRHDDGLPAQTERGNAGPSVSTSMGSGPAETYQPPSATGGGTTGTDALNQRPRRATVPRRQGVYAHAGRGGCEPSRPTIRQAARRRVDVQERNPPPGGPSCGTPPCVRRRPPGAWRAFSAPPHTPVAGSGGPPQPTTDAQRPYVTLVGLSPTCGGAPVSWP